MTPEPVALTSGGESLAGDYHPGAGGGPAVLWVHGFGSVRGGEKAAAVRGECDRRGWAFAAFDFRGHGGSGGTMPGLRASGLLEDLAAAHAFLAARGHRRVGLVGSSMGGFASAWFAARNPAAVAACVLLAPAFGFLHRRLAALTDAQREEWRRTDRLRFQNEWVETELGYGLVEEADRFRPADLAAAWRTPTLVFHGMADDVVPAADSIEFLRAVAFPAVELRLFKDGDHRLTAYKDEVAREAGRFLARHW